MEALGYFVGQVAMWFSIALFVGIVLWLIGGAIYFTVLDIRDIPNRRATKAMNARVDAIRAATRERNRAELARLYGNK